MPTLKIGYGTIDTQTYLDDPRIDRVVTISSLSLSNSRYWVSRVNGLLIQIKSQDPSHLVLDQAGWKSLKDEGEMIPNFADAQPGHSSVLYVVTEETKSARKRIAGSRLKESIVETVLYVHYLNPSLVTIVDELTQEIIASEQIANLNKKIRSQRELRGGPPPKEDEEESSDTTDTEPLTKK